MPARGLQLGPESAGAESRTGLLMGWANQTDGDGRQCSFLGEDLGSVRSWVKSLRFRFVDQRLWRAMAPVAGTARLEVQAWG